MEIVHNIEFIVAKDIYKGIWKLVLLFQKLQLIDQTPVASVYKKPPKYILTKVYEE